MRVEEKQSSNDTNAITARSERRSYRSPRFGKHKSHHQLHKPPLTYDSSVWNPQSEEQGNQCVSDSIRKDEIRGEQRNMDSWLEWFFMFFLLPFSVQPFLDMQSATLLTLSN